MLGLRFGAAVLASWQISSSLVCVLAEQGTVVQQGEGWSVLQYKDGGKYVVVHAQGRFRKCCNSWFQFLSCALSLTGVDHRYCYYDGTFTLTGTSESDPSDTTCAPTIVYDGTRVWATVQPGDAKTVWNIKGGGKESGDICFHEGCILITPASGEPGYLAPITPASFDDYGEVDTISEATMEVVEEKSYWEFYGFTDEIDCLLIDLVSRNQEITDGRGGIGVTYDYAGNLGDCKGRVPFQYVSVDPAPWRLTPNYDGSGESEDGDSTGDYLVSGGDEDYTGDYLVSGGEDETGADSEDNAPVSGTTAESNSTAAGAQSKPGKQPVVTGPSTSKNGTSNTTTASSAVHSVGAGVVTAMMMVMMSTAV